MSVCEFMGEKVDERGGRERVSEGGLREEDRHTLRQTDRKTDRRTKRETLSDGQKGE